MRAVAVVVTSLFLSALASAATPAGGRLQLHLSVAGARVVVDGAEALAAAPQNADIPVAAGEHALRVEKEGFQPFESKVTVAPKAVVKLEIVLKLLPPVAPPPPVVAQVPEKTPEKPKGPRGVRVAVYDLKTDKSLDGFTSSLLTESLLAELRKLDRVSAIGMAEVRDMLSFEQQRQMLGCEGGESCLAELGGSLGVDLLLTGNVGTVGESRTFNVRLVDIARAQVKGSASRRLAAGSGEELFAAVGPMVEELLPEYPLRPGRTRGVADAVVARLHPPPLPRGVFFGTAGAGLAALAVGGAFGLSYRTAQSDYQSLLQRALEQPVAGADVKAKADAVQGLANRANVAFLVGGVLAAAAGVEFFFTDWHPEASVVVTPAGVAGTF